MAREINSRLLPFAMLTCGHPCPQKQALRQKGIYVLWVKAFHIIFVVTWFAGLFYLPRLFVYHCTATDQLSLERFKIMERRLFVMMTIGAAGTVLLGLWLLAGFPAMHPNLSAGWMHAKLFLVAGLLAYHGWTWWLMRQLWQMPNQRSAKFYKIVNELPGLFLIGIIILVVVRPF